jgi:hypothetical protein
MFEGGFRQILRREVDAIPLPPEDKWVPAGVSAGFGPRALIMGAASLAILLGVVTLTIAGMTARPATQQPAASEAAPASSCQAVSWPTTEISCVAASNSSVTYLSTAPGPWTTRVWLTTLGAVDARLHPRRQVADHPPSASAPVWLFIYESSGAVDRFLYVSAASNAKPGAFIYIYRWTELGSPQVPMTMPLP